MVLGVLILAITFHLLYRSINARRQKSGGSGFRSRLDRARGHYSSQLQGDELSASNTRTDVEREMEAGNATTTTTAGIDRNTSLRSIMTLPVYSAAARENERVLGREGERAGIDVVVEHPEDQDEEEARREQEMESLYQIRLARRQEQAEREERRQLRREARARGDYQELSALRQRAEGAATESVANQLIAQHQTTDRSRRVSSVQYAELGIARHDGTRIRANSSESDQRPLLDSGASIAGHSMRTLSTHQRGRSASSVLSMSTTGSDDDNHRQRRVSGGSGMSDFEIVPVSNPHSRSASVSHSIVAASGGDMGDQMIPSPDPPMYDDITLEEAPPYSSPVQTRAPQLPINSNRNSSNRTPPQLPQLETLPSIRITNATSPTSPQDAQTR